MKVSHFLSPSIVNYILLFNYEASKDLVEYHYLQFTPMFKDYGSTLKGVWHVKYKKQIMKLYHFIIGFAIFAAIFIYYTAKEAYKKTHKQSKK